MLAQTPIWAGAESTDLAEAFERHLPLSRQDRGYALGSVETAWLNALRERARRTREQHLVNLTDRLLSLLANPGAHEDFKKQFEQTYEEALRFAYPVSRALLDEHHLHGGISRDYTLLCFDPGQVRAIEDDALSDQSMSIFAGEMLTRLTARTKLPRHEVYRSVFDIYSEALLCRLLRERGRGRLRIRKIPETAQAGPDFECELDTEMNGEPRTLSFFIEVKSLDVVDAPQRLPEILDEGMDVQIDLEEQLDQGRRIAIAEGEVAPHRRYGRDPGYDPKSVRLAIENLIQKAAGNFKNTQFQRGPTFALANLLRLPLPGQGAGALAPFYYDDWMGGSCVSGALWNFAFGEVGAPIHRAPDFEGAGTVDGTLRRAGVLIDKALELESPGLIALHYDQGAYRLDGFYDERCESKKWTWSNIETEEVFQALCGDYNNRANERAHRYARGGDRNIQDHADTNSQAPTGT
ncbi:hypothetical protein [Bradyrhizobium diazoefficiens]|uniref:hypothetical protein n=1 Tax=Bradyrhizobium diazoefficiens TaxID=1355477 RepID=UPI00272B545A|nr:hypothetical protein [Bradyrhizobium diazoefficiens]WLA64929.1 hypothetical protein QNN01_43060 [Bradyrhizobium diazoefficiens]